MFRNFFSILFAAIVLAGAHASAAQLEMNIDRPGSDYNSFDLPASNPQMCATRCEQDGRCRAFTYAGPGIQGPNARCWLKHQARNPVGGRAGMVSGVVRQGGSSLNPGFQADMDRPGSDYSNFDLPDANPESCAARCAQDNRCRAFTYVTPGLQGPSARCWLKDQVANPVPARGGVITGVARLSGPVTPPVVQPPPIVTPLAGAWNLKEIRVRNTMDGSVAAVTRQQYDANGGIVDINMNGNILNFCPGGSEKVTFSWRFDRNMSQVTNGSGVSASLEARQTGRNGGCGTQIASRSLMYVYSSSGAHGQLSPQEMQLVDGERFISVGDRKRVAAAEGVAAERAGNVRVNTHAGDPQRPNAYFFVSMDTPTAPGGGQLVFIYIYERSRN